MLNQAIRSLEVWGLPLDNWKKLVEMLRCCGQALNLRCGRIADLGYDLWSSDWDVVENEVMWAGKVKLQVWSFTLISNP